MVDGGGGPEFPVVFFDGEREMNIGSIRIYPLLQFKAFQLMLSQRIGISPNQISIYLCSDRKSSSKFDDRRMRIPITNKANFSLIAREKDCFFLVVLKRSRKSRNRKASSNGPPENMVLLRRNPQPEIMMDFGFGSGLYDSYPNPDPDLDPFPMMMTKSLLMEKKGYKCEECKGNIGNSGSTSGFHHCVNDPVIVGGFRSRFGPVGRFY